MGFGARRTEVEGQGMEDGRQKTPRLNFPGGTLFNPSTIFRSYGAGWVKRAEVGKGQRTEQMDGH